MIDGGSTDGTLTKLQDRKHQLAVLVSEKDQGIYDALNKGIAHATGDIIGFLHADDLYANDDVLNDIASAFKADPTLCAVYGDLLYVKKENIYEVVRYWRSSTFSKRQLNWGWMPPHPTLFVKREWYERIDNFDIKYKISADYFSILQLFSQPEFKSAYLPQVITRMRLGGASNRSLKAIIRKSWEDSIALRRTNIGYFWGLGALLWKNLSKISQFK